MTKIRFDSWLPSLVSATLEEGVERLRDLLQARGFARVKNVGGTGSGGRFDAVTFAKQEREIELWLRYDSLAVTYRAGEAELDHATFMRELLGPAGGNRFPAYADDASAAFDALRHDLERFCDDFLDGPGEDFRRCAAAARHDEQLTGSQRLARIERQLKRS